MEGWEVVKFSEVDEMMIACQVGAPNVVFVDPSLPHQDVLSIPELLHTQNPQSAIRVVALLFKANSFAINEVMKDGYDDFVVNPKTK